MTMLEQRRGFRLFRRDRWTLDDLVQAAILVLSPIAIMLLAETGPVQRWGYVVGLCSQPFWIYATARSGQIGAFVVSVCYLAIWVRGIANHFPELLG